MRFHHLRNVSAAAAEVSSRNPIVGSQSQSAVVHVRLQDWRVARQQRLFAAEAGEGAIRRFRPIGTPIEWSFNSPVLSLFLLPLLSRLSILAMLSHLTQSVDWVILERWIDVIQFTFETTARRALTLGYGAMVGVVEIDRFLDDYDDDDIDQIVLSLLELETGVRDGNFGGALESSIENLQTTTYGGKGDCGGGSDDGGECSCVICYEDFSLHEEVTKMPCQHVFHGPCITQWLRRSHMCPLCRFEMPR